MDSPPATRIRVLSAAVVNRIAAGEVIERPASVVKELVENSLDAGARRVEVEVREGGKALIRVVDDGEGMSREDLALAFVPHATSKLGDVHDLTHIGTMGFRGEALASVGAVARATITSRPAGEAEGYSVENDFGTISEVRPAASGRGTAIEVVDLFRNVPARAKFLKSVGAEMARITQAFHRFGISTPGVELRLTHAARGVGHFPAEMARRERVARAYGRDLLEELIECRAEADGMAIEGLAAPPSRTYSDSTRMLFFLNGRHIRDKTLLHAARQAYQDLIFGSRSPMVFLFLAMDPELVDQNVHPAKLEVRFRRSSAVHSLVHRALRDALTRSDLAHPILLDQQRAEAGGHAGGVKDAVADYLARNRGREGPHQPGLFSGGTPGAGRPSPEPSGAAVDFLQVGKTFIVLETEEGISIVDQHALHERVLYDRFRSRYLEGGMEVQRLLRPAVIEPGPLEVSLILEHREELREIGIMVVEFGEGAVAVHGLPSAATSLDPEDAIEAVLGRLKEDRPAEAEDLVDDLIASLACRAAVKAGDLLSREEVADLLVAAEALTHSHTCPHGRPTRLELSFRDLEKHFKRR